MRMHEAVGYWRAALAKYEQFSSTAYHDDPFVTRMQQLITGMLNPGNLHAFDYALQRLPSPAPLVEIGSFCGLSTNLITYFKRRHGVSNRLITCDRWDYSFKGLDGRTLSESSAVTGTDFGRFAKECFLRNTQFFSDGDLPFTVESFSGEFLRSWSEAVEATDVFGRTLRLGGPMSFAFIDGNHDYDFVHADFLGVDSALERGGWILFDDSADLTGSPGPRRLMKELRASRVLGRRYAVVMKNPHYLVRKLSD